MHRAQGTAILAAAMYLDRDSFGADTGLSLATNKGKNPGRDEPVPVILFYGEYSMGKIRRRVLISGRVQGVCFRAYARTAAQEIGVYGWVRNVHDGRVEAVLEGDEDQVGRMLAWCHRGSPHGRVDKVLVYEEPYAGEFNDFDIKYSGYW